MPRSEGFATETSERETEKKYADYADFTRIAAIETSMRRSEGVPGCGTTPVVSRLTSHLSTRSKLAQGGPLTNHFSLLTFKKTGRGGVI
jgi:hypothetical protein